MGADRHLAEDVEPVGTEGDPDYAPGGAANGSDSLLYEVPLAELGGEPAEIRATLYYQAIPPFFLQDRFCTAKGLDTKRLYYLAGKLDTGGSPIQDWKLKVGQTVKATVP